MIDFVKFVHPRDPIVKVASLRRLRTVYRWYEEAARLQQPDKFLEIGVAAGYSSYAVLRGCGDKLPSLVTWIDFCEGKGQPDGHRNYALGLIRGAFDVNLDDRYVNSNNLQDFDDDYDLISIDGDHTISGCLHDLRVAGKHLTPHGHILCHDAIDRPVRDAIDTFCEENHGDFVQISFFNLYQGCIIVHRSGTHLDTCPMFSLLDMFNK